MNRILHKALVRENLIEEDDPFDIFEKNVKFSKLRNEIDGLGNLAFEQLQYPDFEFTENELRWVLPLDSIILKSNLLIPYKSIRSHKEETRYQFVHRTFSEFLAAFHVWNSESENLNDIISNLMKEQSMPSLDTLFCPFLAGLLD